MNLIGLRTAGQHGHLVYINPDHIVIVRPAGSAGADPTDIWKALSLVKLVDGTVLQVVLSPQTIAQTIWENEKDVVRS